MARIAPFPATAGPTIAFRDNLGRIQTNTLPSPGLRNAGGVFASDPAAAVGPTGDIYFVARDTAQPTLGSLYFNWLQRDNTYAGWKALAGIVQGTPAIAVTPSHVWMAARDQGGAYWAISYKPSTDTIQSWTYLGGVLATDPVLASCPDGSVYVAGREPFGAIWTRRWDPSASLWQNWVSLRGITKGKPSIACGFDNGAYIAVRDPSDAVWIGRMYQESSGTWSTGNGVFNDDPQILRSGSDLHVFGLSYSVPWYRTWRLAAGWITPWTEIGGVLNQAAPFAYGGNLFVAGLASNGELWWWNGLTTSWTNFGNNGVAPGARLSAARK